MFNNLPLEIKNVAGNQKKIKITLKKFLHTHFTQLKSTLVNHELRTVSQDFIIVICWFMILSMCKYSWIVFKFYVVTLCKYFIDCVIRTDHISLYELDVSYLYIIITIIYFLSPRLTLYYACYLMTSISTLMDL